MSDTAGGPAGLMVLHLWTEPGERMRVRITSTVDIGSEEVRTTYATTTAQVVEQVQDWIGSLVTPR